MAHDDFPPEVQALLERAKSLPCALCHRRQAEVTGLLMPDTPEGHLLWGSTPTEPKLLAFAVCQRCWSLSDKGPVLTLAVELALVEDALLRWTRAGRAGRS